MSNASRDVHDVKATTKPTTGWWIPDQSVKAHLKKVLKASHLLIDT